jgi:hypothetical protein
VRSARKAGPKAGLPLGDALQPTIDRLKAIAAASGDALLTEGPVQPDAALLGLCGDALHFLTAAKDASTERAKIDWCHEISETDRRRDAELLRAQYAAEAGAKQLLRRAIKLRATTPAGVYAKALIVRSSRTGAAILAMSLAEDLIACEGLRQSLWPAVPVEAAA